MPRRAANPPPRPVPAPSRGSDPGLSRRSRNWPAPNPDWHPPSPDWWTGAFQLRLTASEAAGHRCGQHQMLTLVAYDITDQKRLHQIARICEDWGVRVQYSVFECRLEADAFDRFWSALQELIDPKEDRLVAYPVCLRCAREVRTAGTMVVSEKVVAYVC